jgi:hypothetical protein
MVAATAGAEGTAGNPDPTFWSLNIAQRRALESGYEWIQAHSPLARPSSPAH